MSNAELASYELGVRLEELHAHLIRRNRNARVQEDLIGDRRIVRKGRTLMLNLEPEARYAGLDASRPKGVSK